MTNPPTPPYTEATVELAAQAMAARTKPSHHGQHCPVWTRKAAIAECDCWILQGARGQAPGVLNALVKAGLLLPEGVETRTEYGVEHAYPGLSPVVLVELSRSEAERKAAPVAHFAAKAVMSRTTWSTPWRPVGPKASEGALSSDVSAGGVVGRRAAEGGGEADQSKEQA